MDKTLRLFFWSSKMFENKTLENYGDLLSPYIVEKVSKKKITFYNAAAYRKKWFQPSYIMAIGSIMSYASKKAYVWGSGIISRQDTFKNARFCAVRGPLSRKRILELGHSCPEVYGDPALLLPEYYNPKIKKTHQFGIIPHYVDYEQVANIYGGVNDCNVIDLMTKDIHNTTDEILSCKAIISSSLHGVIVAQAYGIPAVWVRFSEKLSGDNVKFEDYFRSVGLAPYEGKLTLDALSIEEMETVIKASPNLPESEKIKELTQGLVAAFPDAI